MQTIVEASVPMNIQPGVKDRWEEAYPGFGEVILDVLGPCYSSEVSIGSPMGEGIMDVARDVYRNYARPNGTFKYVVEQRYVEAFRGTRPMDFLWLSVLVATFPLPEIPKACLHAMREGNVNGFEHLADVLPPDIRLWLWRSYMHVVQNGFASVIEGDAPERVRYYKRLIEIWHSGCLPVGRGKTFRGADAVIFMVREP